MNKLRKLILRWLLGESEESIISSRDSACECYRLSCEIFKSYEKLFEDYKRLSKLNTDILRSASRSEDIESFRLKMIAILLNDKGGNDE